MRYAFCLTILFSTVLACRNNSKENKISSTTDSTKKISAGSTTVSHADSLTGHTVFVSLCSKCHKDTSILRAPSKGVLSTMTPRAILEALDNGRMKTQASELTEDQRRAVAQWITGQPLHQSAMPAEAFTSFYIHNNSGTYSGWGGNLEATGFRPKERAGISLSNLSSLKLKWAFAFPDANQVRCKPAVIGDWLIVGDQYGDVYAIHKQTGKIGWTFLADAAIRGAIALTEDDGRVTAYFADYSTNTYAIAVNTGKLIWKKRAGYHPESSVTGSVAVYGGMVYVPITSFEVISSANPEFACCTSSGGLVALDAKTGNEKWVYRVIDGYPDISGHKKNGKPIYGPSGAPVWSSPTVDAKRGLIYIGTGENYTVPATPTSDAIQAIDLKTGKLVWSFQGTKNDTWNLACPDGVNCPPTSGPDLDFGMAPILLKRKNEKDILVVGEKSGVVFALSPEDGKLIWKTRIGKGGALGGIHWGMATDGQQVYAANADNIWAIDKRDSAIKASPGLYALDPATGKVNWMKAPPPCDTTRKDCNLGNSAAPTVIPGIVFAGTLDGHIRAYASSNGEILWDFDTVKDYDGINGLKGKGGALDGAAPVVSNGMLFVNSGYGSFGQMPGNVLLAFEIAK
jgi:polyvinyl alcohol dehydrogenase (cytochrome)